MNSQMPNSLASPLVYDRRTRILHWSTAILVVAIWLTAQVINLVPKGPPRWNTLGIHMTMGVLLGIVLVYRIRWRLGRAVRLPIAGNVWVRASAHAMHFGLYAALIVAILLGLCTAWVRGVHVFSWFVLPAFDPGDKVLRVQIRDLHILLANYILISAALHGIAALVHHFVLHDGTLHRMWVSRAALARARVD